VRTSADRHECTRTLRSAECPQSSTGTGRTNQRTTRRRADATLQHDHGRLPQSVRRASHKLGSPSAEPIKPACSHQRGCLLLPPIIARMPYGTSLSWGICSTPSRCARPSRHARQPAPHTALAERENAQWARPPHAVELIRAWHLTSRKAAVWCRPALPGAPSILLEPSSSRWTHRDLQRFDSSMPHQAVGWATTVTRRTGPLACGKPAAMSVPQVARPGLAMSC